MDAPLILTADEWAALDKLREAAASDPIDILQVKRAATEGGAP